MIFHFDVWYYFISLFIHLLRLRLISLGAQDIFAFRLMPRVNDSRSRYAGWIHRASLHFLAFRIHTRSINKEYTPLLNKSKEHISRKRIAEFHWTTSSMLQLLYITPSEVFTHSSSRLHACRLPGIGHISSALEYSLIITSCPYWDWYMELRCLYTK